MKECTCTGASKEKNDQYHLHCNQDNQVFSTDQPNRHALSKVEFTSCSVTLSLGGKIKELSNHVIITPTYIY